MTSETITDLCDAVADDLTVLPLPRHRVWKYLDPPTVRADQGPVLAIFVREEADDVLATTGDYEDDLTLVVAWFYPAATATEAPDKAQAIARDALGHAQTLRDRLKSYAETLDGIPGFSPQAEVTVTGTRYGLIEGGLYLAEIKLRVKTWTT